MPTATFPTWGKTTKTEPIFPTFPIWKKQPLTGAITPPITTKREGQGGVEVEEGIWVMPDYSVVSGNRTIGRIDPETGEFIEKEKAWWEKLGQILKWLPPNIPQYRVVRH